jgi:hypothetical protein
VRGRAMGVRPVIEDCACASAEYPGQGDQFADSGEVAVDHFLGDRVEFAGGLVQQQMRILPPFMP